MKLDDFGLLHNIDMYRHDNPTKPFRVERCNGGYMIQIWDAYGRIVADAIGDRKRTVRDHDQDIQTLLDICNARYPT